MQSSVKSGTMVENATFPLPKQSFSQVLGDTIKTGIIKSNVTATFAGLALALYINQISPFDKWLEMVLTLVGSTLVIGSAGALNNLYDRDIDSIMERTKNRPTVTGVIKPKSVLWLSITMGFFGLLALAFTTPLAAILGFLGMFLYVVPYSMWTKRRTIYNTEVGSFSGAMPPLIGWAAIDVNLTHPAIIGLFVITLIWQMPHFYAIAIRKHDEYKAAKVPMLPVVKGVTRTYWQTNFYLVLLILASFLFLSTSLTLTIIALILSVAWLILSISGYKKMDAKKWATKMFVFSIIQLTLFFLAVIIFSVAGIFLNF